MLRAATPGLQRQLVVLPTNTWQAYNMYDRDGDGWGDTWYAGGDPPVELDRPYRDRGVPPRFKAYDRAILRWLLRSGKVPDMVADDDLEAFGSGDELRALYDLVVFPGHSEYMTGTPTTSSSGSATSAGGSSSCRRTTSSGGSTSRGRG